MTSTLLPRSLSPLPPSSHVPPPLFFQQALKRTQKSLWGLTTVRHDETTAPLSQGREEHAVGYDATIWSPTMSYQVPQILDLYLSPSHLNNAS